MGPDTKPLGERSNTPRVTQAQIAATVAAFVGKRLSARGAESCAALDRRARRGCRRHGGKLAQRSRHERRLAGPKGIR
jgi:hypothetical protein